VVAVTDLALMGVAEVAAQGVQALAFVQLSEELVRGRCEIPGYSTLDDMAARIRMEQVDPKTRRSLYDALKQPAGAARVSKFKEHLAHLAWADSLGPTAAPVKSWPGLCTPQRGGSRASDQHPSREPVTFNQEKLPRV